MYPYLEICEKAAIAAGAVLREKLGKVGFREKKRADLVTEADTAAQEVIAQIVKKAFPDHAFLGEEMPGAASDSLLDSPNRFCWVVDPLDGTTNFVHQIPFFCTSIALVQGREPICGIIYNPISGEFFSAEKGKGAFMNDEPIRVSSVTQASESLVAVGFPPNTQPDAPDLQAFLKAVPVAQAIRRTGSTALNLAYVAAGRMDAMWGFSTNAWDIAAGIVLLREAGGVVSAPDGQRFSLDQPSFICAANEELLQHWQGILQQSPT